MRENYSKSTQIAITVCKFSKIFGGEHAPEPLYFYLFLEQLQICSVEKKTLEKNVEIMPTLLKFVATPLAIFSAIT